MDSFIYKDNVSNLCTNIRSFNWLMVKKCLQRIADHTINGGTEEVSICEYITTQSDIISRTCTEYKGQFHFVDKCSKMMRDR